MKEVDGDLVVMGKRGDFDVIVHGCNCMCTMGSGIARQIRDTFPSAYTADCKTKSGDISKLGKYTFTTVGNLTIVNAYTQFDYVRYPPPCDYGAIRAVFKRIKKDFAGKRIGYPKIGAGLAGGDWDRISAIINEELEGEDHTLVNFVP